MANTVRHSHRCQVCGTRTPCWGRLEDNYDGEPEIICVEFHLKDGEINPDFFCEGCACVDCGDRSEVTDPETRDRLCESCDRKRGHLADTEGEYVETAADGEAMHGKESPK